MHISHILEHNASIVCLWQQQRPLTDFSTYIVKG